MTDDRPQSILSHLEELRWRLLKAFIAVLIGGLIAFIFANDLRGLLEAPFRAAAPDADLQSLAVAEKWGVLMRVGLFGGVILASPVILYQLWAFINPALTSRERKWAIPIVAAMVTLFTAGVAFGYWAFPRGLQFLLGVFPDVENNLRLGDYYSFALRFLFAFGLAFLYPVFLFAAAAAGLISSEKLASGRRWAVLIVVAGAAAITPSGDAFTLLVLSAPLYLMYEITYWLVRLVLKK
ncbi:MAG TPA: twin-arginine translocase subunit TatC [Acidimicrobiia bacterium]|nr:twin-arginine translocase subunit TatC [Acidimicrobiia bacterium]